MATRSGPWTERGLAVESAEAVERTGSRPWSSHRHDARSGYTGPSSSGARQASRCRLHGHHTYDHLPNYLVYRDEDLIAGLFTHDIEQGIQGTEVKAAFVKCAADAPGVNQRVEKVHRAAARASVRTGVR